MKATPGRREGPQNSILENTIKEINEFSETFQLKQVFRNPIRGSVPQVYRYDFDLSFSGFQNDYKTMLRISRIHGQKYSQIPDQIHIRIEDKNILTLKMFPSSRIRIPDTDFDFFQGCGSAFISSGSRSSILG
jgi:hypothetical protein